MRRSWIHKRSLPSDAMGEDGHRIATAAAPGPALALLASVLLALSVTACGGSALGPGTTVERRDIPLHPGVAFKPEAPARRLHADADHDNDPGTPDIDAPGDQLNFTGRPAKGAERAAITALVRRFYAAALAENGTRACSLLYSPLAEAAVEDYTPPAGPEYLRGARDCEQVTAGIFRYYRPALVAEVPRLRVLKVLVKERAGIVLLGFGALPERKLPVIREGHTWRIDALQDSELS